MKINPLAGTAGRSIRELSSIDATKTDFKTVLQSVKGAADLGFDRSLSNLDQLRQKISKSVNLSPVQLLQYQIHISELNLRVELVSKAAESAAALVRKLQNAQ